MLPRMEGKKRVAIIGAGRLGSALATSLHDAGFTIDAIVARTQSKSRKKAAALAQLVGARTIVEITEMWADVVWFCVPDSDIASAAAALANKIPWQGKIALHSSGALTSDELSSLRSRGAAVASVHPLMTFVEASRPGLEGVAFAVEGDSQAVRVARKMVRQLGGRAYPIRKQDKAAYHAWGTFASPLLTALLATTEQVARLAGVQGTGGQEEDDSNPLTNTGQLCGIGSGARIQRADNSWRCEDRETSPARAACVPGCEGSVCGAGASGRAVPSCKEQGGAPAFTQTVKMPGVSQDVSDFA